MSSAKQAAAGVWGGASFYRCGGKTFLGGGCKIFGGVCTPLHHPENLSVVMVIFCWIIVLSETSSTKIFAERSDTIHVSSAQSSDGNSYHRVFVIIISFSNFH
jgi:hypothetical protein